MEIYHWRKCSTCRDARQRLRERGVEVAERDFFAEPLSRVEIEALAAKAGGIRNIFAFGSPSFRSLERDRDSLTASEMVDLVLGEPRFLKRPLLVDGTRVWTGGQVGEAGP